MCNCDFYVKQAYEMNREIKKLRAENGKLKNLMRKWSNTLEIERDDIKLWLEKIPFRSVQVDIDYFLDTGKEE